MTSNQDPDVSFQQPGTPPTVVVTGAAKGIGAAIVRRLVADGFRVIAGVRRTEDAQRYDRAFRGFVYTGGIGAVSANLSHTIEATVAFVHGYSSAQDNTVHTYTASRDTFVYYDSIANRSGITVSGGTGCTLDETNGRFVFVECANGSAAPELSVDGLLLLFETVTDADNITAVNDFRPTNSERADVVNLFDALVGAKCDDIADDTAG